VTEAEKAPGRDWPRDEHEAMHAVNAVNCVVPASVSLLPLRPTYQRQAVITQMSFYIVQKFSQESRNIRTLFPLASRGSGYGP